MSSPRGLLVLHGCLFGHGWHICSGDHAANRTNVGGGVEPLEGFWVLMELFVLKLVNVDSPKLNLFDIHSFLFDPKVTVIQS